METQQYKRTLAGSIGAGMGAIFNGSGRTYYILEHKTSSKFHQAGESQKIIVDQVELGRGSSCQVRFGDDCETVSRRHAAIIKDGDNWKILQLSETNGTYVNGQPVQGERILQSGDEIRLSSHGPVMGFIVPQGAKSMVSSIGLTERMNLFRQQALAPYKRALWIMGVTFVLAVGGLTAYLIHQHNIIKGLKDDFAGQKMEVEEWTKKALDSERIVEQLEYNMQQIKDASVEERQAAERQISAARQDALEARRQAEKEIAVFKEEIAKLKGQGQISDGQSNTLLDWFLFDDTDDRGSNTKQGSGNTEVQKISSCYNSVYFVKINKISVYDARNREIVTFNTEGKIGGSAFILDDGRFITARRVIEPWLYYRDGIIGDDKDGNEWNYRDLQYCVNNGCNIVAEGTAYSPSGDNFKFNNGDFQKQTLETGWSIVEKGAPSKYVKSVVKKANVENLYWYTTDYRHDWAVMRRQASDGLNVNSSFARSPKSGTEVSLVGYPRAHGLSSMNVTPSEKSNSINVSGLNKDEVIELSSTRWVEGYEGAPALIQENGTFAVIGILSHAESGRDIVIPIHYVGQR